MLNNDLRDTIQLLTSDNELLIELNRQHLYARYFLQQESLIITKNNIIKNHVDMIKNIHKCMCMVPEMKIFIKELFNILQNNAIFSMSENKGNSNFVNTIKLLLQNEELKRNELIFEQLQTYYTILTKIDDKTNNEKRIKFELENLFILADMTYDQDFQRLFYDVVNVLSGFDEIKNIATKIYSAQEKLSNVLYFQDHHFDSFNYLTILKSYAENGNASDRKIKSILMEIDFGLFRTIGISLESKLEEQYSMLLLQEPQK